MLEGAVLSNRQSEFWQTKMCRAMVLALPSSFSSVVRAMVLRAVGCGFNIRKDHSKQV